MSWSSTLISQFRGWLKDVQISLGAYTAVDQGEAVLSDNPIGIQELCKIPSDKFNEVSCLLFHISGIRNSCARYTIDGSTPTATHGWPCKCNGIGVGVNATYIGMIEGCKNIQRFKIVPENPQEKMTMNYILLRKMG